MAYTTAAALLASVNDAIQALIEGGVQTYTISMPNGGSQTFTKLDLAQLRSLKATLETEVTASTRSRWGVASFRAPAG